MARPRKTDEEIQETREKILEAAQDILHEDGFEALSIRSIAERMGISHMTLYTYFDSMDALRNELGQLHQKNALVLKKELMERAQTDNFEGVLDEVFAQVRSLTTERNRFRLAWGFNDGPDQCHSPHKKGHGFDFIAEIIREGIRRGVLHDRDPEIASAIILGLINGPLMAHHARNLFTLEFANHAVDEGIEIAKSYLIIGYRPQYLPHSEYLKKDLAG